MPEIITGPPVKLKVNQLDVMSLPALVRSAVAKELPGSSLPESLYKDTLMASDGLPITLCRKTSILQSAAVTEGVKLWAAVSTPSLPTNCPSPLVVCCWSRIQPAPGEGEGLTDAETLGDGESEADELAEGESEREADADGERLAEGLRDLEAEALGLREADGERERLALAEGLKLADGDIEREALADGLRLAEGDWDALADADGDWLALGEAEAEGEVLALGETDGETDELSPPAAV